ncbi:helix-turn-helix domain-containing protein [Bradyrhizobium japonicum]|uniref:helix-turn-helix domain-containing protein n=1 Tax=Bradyrhizobium japonicum TaxID=375 RepID=UPI0035DFC909
MILPMNRRDIADYLGLSLETVSRSLSTLRHERLLDFDGTTQRRVRLLDRHGLSRRDASGIDAVESSSTGTRVPRSGRRLRLPRFGGAAYAVIFDSRPGYREVGLSSAWR